MKNNINIFIFLSILCITSLFSGCGELDGSTKAVIDFAEALADSDYTTAWELITNESQERYNFSATTLLEFGWLEVDSSLGLIAPGIKEEDFNNLTGRMLFGFTVAAAPETRNLSTSIKSVSYPDSNLAIVVMKTGDGLQEIIVKRFEGLWRVDLLNLEPAIEYE
jgi:hypothetical protein